MRLHALESALVPRKRVCAHFGICARTLNRWIANCDLNFPRPISVNRRWYFEGAEIEAWKIRRANGSEGA